MSYRLGLLEDEDLTRLTLSTALQALGHQVVLQDSDVGRFLAKSSTASLDAVLLDLHLGSGPTGFDVALELRRQNPTVGIVFLTSFQDPRLLNPKLGDLPEGSVYLVKGEIKEIAVLDGAVASALAKLEGYPPG